MKKKYKLSILNNQDVDIVTDNISLAGFQIKIDFSFFFNYR